MPFTATTTGFQRSAYFGPSFCIGSFIMNGLPGWRLSKLNSRSMPVQNARSPAPVSTMARTSSS